MKSTQHGRLHLTILVPPHTIIFWRKRKYTLNITLNAMNHDDDSAQGLNTFYIKHYLGFNEIVSSLYTNIYKIMSKHF